MKDNTKLPLNNYLNNIKFHNINTINNKTISKLNISNLNNHSKNIPKLLNINNNSNNNNNIRNFKEKPLLKNHFHLTPSHSLKSVLNNNKISKNKILSLTKNNSRLNILIHNRSYSHKNNNNNNILNINNNNNENINNNFEIYKNKIIELKKIILEKDEEIEKIRNDSMQNQKDELNNVIQNNTKNLEQLKTIYQLLIDGKDNRIKELEEEIISYEKEIELLKEENNNLKNECRKDKILSEAEVNNLKNQKIELQCLLEQGGGSSNTLLNMTNITSNDNVDKEKIINLENEIKIKNKQIMLLTQNHENDLKELNLAIEMLKQKISQLEEENICLSARNKKDKNEDNKKQKGT